MGNRGSKKGFKSQIFKAGEVHNKGHIFLNFDTFLTKSGRRKFYSSDLNQATNVTYHTMADRR